MALRDHRHEKLPNSRRGYHSNWWPLAQYIRKEGGRLLIFALIIVYYLSLESKTEKVKVKDKYVCVMLKCGDCCIRQILASLFSSILFIVIITSYNWDIGDFGYFLRQWLVMG